MFWWPWRKYSWVYRKCREAASKTIEMTETVWTITQNSSITLNHPSLAFWPRISDRLFCEAGIMKNCLSCLGKAQLSTSLHPLCHFGQHSVCSWSKGSSLASLPHLTNSIWRFFCSHHLLWSGIGVLPGTDLSHCQKSLSVIKYL